MEFCDRKFGHGETDGEVIGLEIKDGEITRIIYQSLNGSSSFETGGERRVHISVQTNIDLCQLIFKFYFQ